MPPAGTTSVTAYHVRPLGTPKALASHSFGNTTNKSENGSSKDGGGGGGGHLEYIAYFLIPVFFLMGLLGVLICHVLKRKGYRCTTEAEEEDEQLEEKIELNDSVNENSDTVGRIVDYIMKNEANADVLKAMVADNSVCDPESPTTPGSPTSPGSPLSPGGPLSKHTCRGHHLHTIGGVAETGACSRCSQKRWNLFSPNKRGKEAKKSRHGQVTVLSVGRFRVTKVEQKSAAKDRKHLVSVSGGHAGDMPSTPGKESSKEQPASLPVTPESKELKSAPTKQGKDVSSDSG
ncbi:RELT-like protein 1 [Pseudonaja textilis]|uniref:RELT-like protein 1 n=1 Tax=Pseudonaja textilis TaxID=8673 RepID=UPI000EA9EA19|nr:RELT-like protein 1 [Pseudonaja textilis]XP_026555652.1 RELT-like protein 1 [Pseudonaja textilis]